MSEDLRDDRLTRYLLAGLPPDEEERLEQEYLRGGDAYDRLLAAEDDLIDAYAAGRLEGDEARRFEARFLATPERRERVAFARALRDLADREEPRAIPRSSRSWLLPVAALVPLLVAGAWSFLGLRGSAERMRAERDALEREAADGRSRAAALEESLRLERTASKVASWSLSTGLERGAPGAAVLAVPAGVDTVRLRLRLPASAPDGPLQVTVETAEGRPVASLHGLRPAGDDGGRAVEVHLPAASLAAGTYVALVHEDGPARETVGAYSFQVARAR